MPKTSHVVDGTYDLKMDLGEKVTIHIAALNFQGNQYKKIFEKELENFCESLYKTGNGSLQENFEDFHKHAQNTVPWNTCPYPKGPNELTNLLLEDKTNLMPQYVPGGEKWQVQVRYFTDDILMGGLNLFALLRSEQSLMNGG